MKKLQVGALALMATLLVGGGTVFATQSTSQQEKEIKATATTQATAVDGTNAEAEEKAGEATEMVAATETVAAIEATEEEQAAYEKALETATATTPSQEASQEAINE